MLILFFAVATKSSSIAGKSLADRAICLPTFQCSDKIRDQAHPFRPNSSRSGHSFSSHTLECGENEYLEVSQTPRRTPFDAQAPSYGIHSALINDIIDIKRHLK